MSLRSTVSLLRVSFSYSGVQRVPQQNLLQPLVLPASTI